MLNPKVSIVMNCYNGEKYVREAIDSVYSQTYGNWEIIFWDNASTDRTPEIAKSYDQRLKYFRSGETVILGKARNCALEKCEGELIAFLDSDDLWLPMKLEKQVPLFENEKVGLVYSDTFFFTNSGREWRYYENGFPPQGKCFRKMFVDYFLSLETVVIRRQALLQLKEWVDPTLTFAEEADLFLRIAFDWEVDAVYEPLGKWRINPEGITSTVKEHSPKETLIMLDKFVSSVPDFEKDYKKEIHAVRKKIAKEWAIINWEKGDKVSSRANVRPYLFEDKFSAVLYTLSFFPKPVFDSIRSLNAKTKGARLS